MCALCGVLGVEHHWSAAPTGGAAGAASADPVRRRADRRHRMISSESSHGCIRLRQCSRPRRFCRCCRLLVLIRSCLRRGQHH